MADISKIKIGDTTYDVKDEVARSQGGGGEDQRIITGTIANNDYAVIPCTFCQLTYGGANTTYSGMAVYSAGNVKSISSTNGFDIGAADNGISIDNYCGATAYYIAIIIE